MTVTNEPARRKRDEGFTLIELLVVVLIIGILAAIAIPVFLGQQNQAKDAASQSDLANAKIAMISWQTANPSVTTAPAYTALKTYGYTPSVSGYNATVTFDATASKFCIAELSASGPLTGTTHSFTVTDTSGIAKGTCASGVAAAGTW